MSTTEPRPLDPPSIGYTDEPDFGVGPGDPEPVPLEYAGKWLAWSNDGLKILAVADDLGEAIEGANRAGEPDPILQVG